MFGCLQLPVGEDALSFPVASLCVTVDRAAARTPVCALEPLTRGGSSGDNNTNSDSSDTLPKVNVGPAKSAALLSAASRPLSASKVFHWGRVSVSGRGVGDYDAASAHPGPRMFVMQQLPLSLRHSEWRVVSVGYF